MLSDSIAVLKGVESSLGHRAGGKGGPASVVLSPQAGPNRTFAPEITVFYDMWWKDANASQRATVRQLVQEGRLEWTGGGWTQHDEVP